MLDPDKKRRIIWVVDDSPTDAERARAALSTGYEVAVFRDGTEVLERLHNGAPPDLLVLDWVMPGISGIEVCQYLRASNHADVAILLLTRQNEAADVAEGLKAGANDFLGKPYSTVELLARVASLIRTRGMLERYHEMESTVRVLLANAPDPLIAVDAEGRITYCNEQAISALGQPQEALLGRAILDVVPGLAMDTIAVGSGQPLLTQPDVRIGARIFSPSVRLLPTDNAANTTISLRDVTERRSAEARRLDFYSMIAHDLRTPLSAMLIRTEIMLRKRAGNVSADITGDVYALQRGINALVAMVNDFLDLARMEGTSRKIEPGNVDLRALVLSTVEDFGALAEASALKLTIDVPEQPVTVRGDQRRLVQVLTNLLGNALKFTPAGGSVRTRVVVVPGYVDTIVEDTGRGIIPEALPRIFERYTRALDAEHEVAGTGLGLMIVKEIVEAHGGSVGVTSKRGEGSTFWFRLPFNG